MSISKIAKLASVFKKKAEDSLLLSYANNYLQLVMNPDSKFKSQKFEFDFLVEPIAKTEKTPAYFKITVDPEHFYDNAGTWYNPTKMGRGLLDHIKKDKNYQYPIFISCYLTRKSQMIKPDDIPTPISDPTV